MSDARVTSAMQIVVYQWNMHKPRSEQICARLCSKYSAKDLFSEQGSCSKRDVIYNLMSGYVFESLQSPLLLSKLGVASLRHLCKWRSCWGAQCTHREHRGTPLMLYNWEAAPISYCWGTPLMPYNWGTPPTPHPIYFIASGLREMGQTRAGGIDPSVRASRDHLCISRKSATRTK